MARGKYAEKAAKRQAELAVTSDLASYQHRVAKLTAENRELRETLDAERRANAQAQKRLRAERDEGVAPQVEALRLQLDGAKRAHLAQIDRIAATIKAIVDRRPDSAFAIDVADIAVVIGSRWGALVEYPTYSRRARRIPAPKAQALIEAAETIRGRVRWPGSNQ